MDPMLLHKWHCYQWILSALPLVLRSGLPVGSVFLDEYGTWMGFGRFINPNRVDSGLIYPDLIRFLWVASSILIFWHTPSSENWRKLWLSVSWSGQNGNFMTSNETKNDRQNWSFPFWEAFRSDLQPIQGHCPSEFECHPGFRITATNEC